MKNDWLKNNLEKRLGDKATAFDMDAVWDEIQAKRTPRKNRRLIWLPIILFSAFISFGIYQAYKGAIIDDAKKPISLESGTTKQNKIVQQEQQLNPSSANRIKTTPIENETTITPVKQLSNEVFAIEIPVQERLEENPREANINNNFEANENKDQINSSVTNLNSFINRTKKINQFSNHKSENKNRADAEVFLGQKTELKEVDAFKIAPVLFNKTPLEFLRINPLNHDVDFGLNSNSELIKNAKLPIYFGFEFSYGNSNRMLKVVQDDLEEWLELRNAREKMLDQISGGLTIRWAMNNGFYFQTGLEYQQYTSSLNVDVYDFSSEIVIDTVSILVNPEGQVLSAVEGAVLVQNSMLTRYTRFQKYSNIGVPVLLGKNFKLSNKSNLSVNAGLIVSLSTFNKGEIQSDVSSPQLFGLIRDQGYNQNLLFQSNISAEYHYFISNKLSVFGGLNMKADLTNRSNSNSGFSDKFYSYNLKIGWMKSF